VQIGTNYGAARLDPDYAEVPPGDALDAAVRSDYDLPDDVNFLTTSGEINWTIMANHIIMQQMSNDGTLDKVDGVIAHIYSRYPALESSRYRQLDIIDKTWGEDVPGIEKWVTEWSRKASTDAFDRGDGYGLKTAHEIVAMFSILGQYNVEAAYYWTPQHNTVTALAKMIDTPDGEAPPLTAAGEMYKKMSENIRDLNGVDMAPDNPNSNGFLADGVNYYAYVKPAKMVFYITNETDETKDVEIDFSTYVDGYASIELTRLGVVPGESPGDPRSTPLVTTLESAASVDGTTLTETLKPYEVLQVVVEGANLSKDVTEGLFDIRTAAGTPLDGLIVDPEDDLNVTTPPDQPDDPPDEFDVTSLGSAPKDDPAEQDETADAPTDPEDGGGVTDLLMLLGLPLLLALAFAA
jgi:hypothetical protein